MFMEVPKPIDFKGWYKIKIEEVDEGLNGLSILGMSGIKVEPYFYNKGYKKSEIDIYVRDEIINKLINVSLSLPKGYSLLIYDGWRSNELQNKLFEEEKERKENINGDRFFNTEEYIYQTSIDKKKINPESTGGSIGLTILSENGKPLNMGTEFNQLEEKSFNYYEELNEEIKKNRKFLLDIMQNEGFINNLYWWRFDFGTQHWAKIKNEKAIYGEIKK